MQKKVMILTPFYPPNIGGAETFADELFNEAVKHCNTIVCTIGWYGIWKGINWRSSLGVVWDLLLKAKEYCVQHRPDTVHALGFNAAFVGAILKPFFKFKLIVTPLALYDFDNKLLATLVRWTLKHADLIFAESNMSKRNLSIVADHTKIKVFTHWVNTKKFFPIKKKYKQLKVLFAGRTLREKGGHIIKQVEKELKGVGFVYAENVAIPFMPSYFQMADVLVVPSLYAESPNRVVAEGASCGCVVVTSNVGALPEQVRLFGFAIEPTVKAFGNIINNFDKDRKMLSIFREGTIKYAQKYLTEKNAERIIDEY